MIPWNDKATLRRVDNPILAAIRTCVAVRGYAGKPITAALLDEVGAAIGKATRCQCVAYHEVDLVPAADGMVRVKIVKFSGQVCTLTAFRSPMKREAA